MKITNLNYDQVDQFSDRDKAYVNEDPNLRNFFLHEVNIDQFKQVIELKKKQSINRTVLADSIENRYHGIETSSAVKQNIELIREANTYTITTAHQPSLLTGPLYFIYKICSTINLCRQLSETYKSFNFVPVFVSGGEDHDWEEINHFKLYNRKISWERPHNGEPVGSLNLDGFDQVLSQLEDILRDGSDSSKLLNSLKEYSANSPSYGDFVLKMVNHIFGDYGLVFVNMNDKSLKSLFREQIKNEIFENTSKPLVEKQQAKLEDLGFKSQAYTREINFFFFHEDGRRLRIEQEGELFKVLDSSLSFTAEEMEQLINESPERFSPNVIIRPLYQEYILPNLAYIGGGGEIAYWLERKLQFEAFSIPFPMLIRRNSVLLLDHTSKKMLRQLDFQFENTLKKKHIVVNEFLLTQAGDEFSMEDHKKELEAVFSKIKDQTESLDKSLVGRVESEKVKAFKSIDAIESKLKKVIKQRSETNLGKIDKLYNRLTPDNSLQERKNNILEYLDNYDISLIDHLVNELNPLEKFYKILDLTSME